MVLDLDGRRFLRTSYDEPDDDLDRLAKRIAEKARMRVVYAIPMDEYTEENVVAWVTHWKGSLDTILVASLLSFLMAAGLFLWSRTDAGFRDAQSYCVLSGRVVKQASLPETCATSGGMGLAGYLWVTSLPMSLTSGVLATTCRVCIPALPYSVQRQDSFRAFHRHFVLNHHMPRVVSFAAILVHASTMLIMPGMFSFATARRALVLLGIYVSGFVVIWLIGLIPWGSLWCATRKVWPATMSMYRSFLGNSHWFAALLVLRLHARAFLSSTSRALCRVCATACLRMAGYSPIVVIPEVDTCVLVPADAQSLEAGGSDGRRCLRCTVRGELVDISFTEQIAFRGGMGRVVRGSVTQNGRTAYYAVKYCALQQLTKGELQLWRKLNHPNILELCNVSQLHTSGHFQPEYVFVSPYMENGNLQQYLRMHESADRLPLILDIASGLAYLHDVALIVHGDVKAENVLISDDGRAVLGDFGLSTTVAPGERPTGTQMRMTYTITHCAPEILDDNAMDPAAPSIRRSKTKMTDIYAFGVLIYHAYLGPMALVQGTRIGFMIRMYNGLIPPRPPADHRPILCDDLWIICTSSWAREPSSRPTAALLIKMLQQLHASPTRQAAVSGMRHDKRTACSRSVTNIQ